MTADRTEENGNGAGDGAAVAEVAKRIRTPKSAKLPGVDFDDIRPLVEAMVALNGPSSKNLIFDQADGASGSGGTAKKKWAALGYYGFRVDAGKGKFDVSERGRDFVSGDADRERQAKQHALVSTGFRSIIARFSSRPANKGAIAGILREDFGVPEASTADAFADRLVDLATEAGFIVGGNFKPAPIEAAMEAVPAGSNGGSPSPAGGRTAATLKPEPAAPKPAEPALAATTERTPAPVEPSTDGQATTTVQAVSEGQAGPFELAPVQVVVNVDASKLTAEQLAELVQALREPPEPKATTS